MTQLRGPGALDLDSCLQLPSTSDPVVFLEGSSGALLSVGRWQRRVVLPGEVIAHVGGAVTRGSRRDAADNWLGERGATVASDVAVGAGARLADFDRRSRGGEHTIRVARRDAWLTVVEVYRFREGHPVVQRTVELQWGADAPNERLHRVDVTLPTFSADSLRGVWLPVQAVIGELKDELPEGSLLEQRVAVAGKQGAAPLFGDHGSAIIELRGEDGQPLLAGAFSSECFVMADLHRSGEDITALHRFHQSARLAERRSVPVGTQFLVVAERRASLRSVGQAAVAQRRQVADAVSGRRNGRPDWLGRATIYEAHTGPKFIDPFAPANDGFEPYRDIDALVADLPRIQGLGFDTVQLMPRFPFPGYTIDDYGDPASQYGDEVSLRGLCRAAQQRGMRVILDLIIHGCVDRGIDAYAPWARERSRYLDEHPDWFMQTETGDVARTHTYAFDASNTEVQSHLIAAMDRLVGLGVDGFRVDAPMWNLFPNWRPGLPYPSGRSTLGWVELIERARTRLGGRRDGNLALVGETTGLLGLSVFDACYGYEELQLLRGFVQPERPFLAFHLPTKASPPDAAEIRAWLQDKQDLYAEAALRGVIRHLDSHDSYEWGGLSTYSRDLLGPAFEAVLASFALLPGPWMHFAGAESGIEQLLGGLLRRRTHTAVRAGQLTLDRTVCSDRNVLHLLSVAGADASLVIANLSRSPAEVEVDIHHPIAELQPVHRSRGVRGLDLASERVSGTFEPWAVVALQTRPNGDRGTR